jgi:4-hydroxy-2-oxoheptanedioate aldolase
MQPNPIKTLWGQGKPVLNGWLSIACPFTAEIMAAQGYDALTIDLQHGLIGYEVAMTMLQAMRASGVAPLARVPWLDPGAVMRVLDAGAYGVICPMIETAEEAERLVSFVRYPPIGTRSFGPLRAAVAASAGDITDYGSHADEQMLCFAMIETAQAVAHVDEIVTVPGLDSIYIGPADLTLGLTGKRYRPGVDREEPELIETIRHLLDRAHQAGIRAGLHTGTLAYGTRAVEWGFDLVTVSSDLHLLAGAAHASVQAFRNGQDHGSAR